MRDLSSKIGLPVFFDGENITVDEKFLVIYSQYHKYVKELSEYYLNPVTVFPKLIYKTYWVREQDNRYLFSKINVRVKIFVIFPHVIGVEFAKSKTIHSVEYPRIIESVTTPLAVILHPVDIELSELRGEETKITYYTELAPLEKIVVPPGWAYTIINPTKNVGVVVEVHRKDQPAHVFVEGKRGAPFYLIQRNNSQELVRNPNYRNVLRYAKVDKEKLNRGLAIAPKTPIVKQFLRKYEKFTWFFGKKELDWYDRFYSYLTRVVRISI